MSTVTCFVDCNRQTVVKGAPLGFYRYIGGRITWKRFDMTHSKKRNHLCCRKMLLIIDKAQTETTGLTVFGAAPDPEVQQLIFLWIWPLSGVIAKPDPQTSPWPCHLTSKSDVHFYFDRTEADCTNYFPLFFVQDLQFIYCQCGIRGFLRTGMTLWLTEYFNQCSFIKRDTPLCLPCSKLQQAAVISVYPAGYWCWPWQRFATRWAGSRTSSEEKKKEKWG